MRNVIDEFKGEYAFLSNFYPRRIMFHSIIFPTSEHTYQAAKSLNPEDWNKILQCNTPGQAKRMGRIITIRDDWEDVKLSAMTQIVTAKFEQHPDLMEQLKATGESVLIKGNYWGDTYWGVCRGVGQNHLGQILMNIRDK